MGAYGDAEEDAVETMTHLRINRVDVYGTASLNLAQYASVSEEKELGLNIPLNVLVVASESKPSLSISLSILEMRATQELSETVPGSLLSDEAISTEKDELSPLKAGLRKVKILRDYVSFGKSKKACVEEDSSDSKSSARSEDDASNYPFDTDSLDDDAREESEWSKEDSSVRQSISYETLAYANFAGGLFYSNTNSNGQDDFWVHYSNQWRTLCDNEAYIEHFPDKHFDLETILQAKIRPLSVVPEKSFIGFFHPEELENKDFDFLQGAMSFDSIWDEISRSASECACNSEPLVYIVSWNDHFFVLKVEQDASYIIDTVGERLYEGCNQAHILKFDKDTTIQRLPSEAKASDEKSGNQETKAEGALVLSQKDFENSDAKEVVVCKGGEACKDYIKSFLAAIPIRELMADLKKGLMASTPLHHWLQIEFHCTKLLQSMDEYSVKETAAAAPAMAMALAVA
ncbi:hypothetical protein ACE6H2_006749 [Prunus campanulata]